MHVRIPSGFDFESIEKLQISVDIPVGDISAQQLIPADGQIFRNSNLARSLRFLNISKTTHVAQDPRKSVCEKLE